MRINKNVFNHKLVLKMNRNHYILYNTFKVSNFNIKRYFRSVLIYHYPEKKVLKLANKLLSNKTFKHNKGSLNHFYSESKESKFVEVYTTNYTVDYTGVKLNNFKVVLFLYIFQ